MPAVYLLSDPHLGKDMAPFGEHWVGHEERIAAAWDAAIGDDDVVLVPGDISWAKKLDRVGPHLEWLEQRSGRLKVLTKGNHDWWWTSTTRVREHLPGSVCALDGDAIVGPGLIAAGSKGFISPGDPYFRPSYQKSFNKNLRRAREALEAGLALKRRHPDRPLVFCLHYPPFTSDGQPTPFSEMLEDAPVDWCVFGHFHFRSEWAVCPNGKRNGVEYRLGSVDFLGFEPLELFGFEGRSEPPDRT